MKSVAAINPLIAANQGGPATGTARPWEGRPERSPHPSYLGALSGPVRPQAEAGQERRQQTRGDTHPAVCSIFSNVRRAVCAAGGIAFLWRAAIRCSGASLTRMGMVERSHVPNGATVNGTTDREASTAVGVRSVPTSKLGYDDRGLTLRCAWSTPPAALTA